MNRYHIKAAGRQYTGLFFDRQAAFEDAFDRFGQCVVSVGPA